MSIFERLNPLRIVRTVDTVPRVQNLAEKMREEQKEMSRQLRTITRQLEQLEQTLSRQEKILAGVPELQAQVRRCVTAYTKDARQAEWLPALRATLGDGERIAAHAAAAVARARLELEPFPHILIDNLLPDDVAGELLRAIPSSAFFKTENMKRQELEVPFEFAPEYSRIVWGLFFNKVISEAMVPALTDKFRPALDEFLRTHWPELGSMAGAGIALRVSNSRLLLRRPGYVIKPHRDPRWAFLTCLVYLPRSADHEVYGTQLYRLHREPEVTHSSPLWVDQSECELVKDVPARRNTALVFLNSTGAHGASIPSQAPTGIERYLFQVQFGVDEETKERLIAGVSDTARSSWSADREGRYE
ncbi:MAG TPA: hypothetical protein VFS23_25880 [Vicinamibacterales bacterium]|nr:hypothetical protein [Vicinamibacterales bacterium]